MAKVLSVNLARARTNPDARARGEDAVLFAIGDRRPARRDDDVDPAWPRLRRARDGHGVVATPEG